MKKIFFVLLAIILIAGVVLIGCSKSTTTTTTTPTPTTTTPAPHKVVKVGSVQNLTTPMGLEQQKWLNLLAKVTNAQGGWKIGSDTYDVDMIVYDSQGDAAKAKSYLERLVLQDGVQVHTGQSDRRPGGGYHGHRAKQGNLSGFGRYGYQHRPQDTILLDTGWHELRPRHDVDPVHGYGKSRKEDLCLGKNGRHDGPCHGRHG